MSFNFLLPLNAQHKQVNLMENLKAVGTPLADFVGEPLLRLTGNNYKMAAFSGDLKFMAVSRTYFRKESEIMDIVLIRIKNYKESVLLDTLTMVRYGRPNGFLYDLYFNSQNQLIAKIGDGMKGTSIVTFDPEKREIVADEYIDDYIDEEEEGAIDNTGYSEEKMMDLKRIFPNKTKDRLTQLTYKLMPIDTAGYITQGILHDNSIFFLPRGNGKLRLIHNISDPAQIDNIHGFWGTSERAYYLLKDKKNSYFFKYNITSNVVTLLEKYPVHRHFNYIYSYKLPNNEYLIAFEVEINTAETSEMLKLFRYSNGVLYRIEDYPDLQEVFYNSDNNLLLLYYLKGGKRCLDVRNVIEFTTRQNPNG